MPHDQRDGTAQPGTPLARLVLPRGGIAHPWNKSTAPVVNDQVAGIGAVVVPGTVRDSLHILDTLLNLDAGPKPEMVATDTASYSDIVFGLFRMLGYRFSPRIADLSDQRFWRATLPSAPEGDYGPLNALARNRVSLAKIRTHWGDMLRVAGSLVTSQVRAYDLLRMLGRDGHPTALGQAFAEYGRIAKTLHLLAFVDPADEGYRRVVHRQLTIQESRHRLARKIFHGQRGELRQAYREGQEDQLGALGLVLNAVVLWNTRYTDAAVGWLRGQGQEPADQDAARLSPLADAHINMCSAGTPSPRRPAPGSARCATRAHPARRPDQGDPAPGPCRPHRGNPRRAGPVRARPAGPDRPCGPLGHPAGRPCSAAAGPRCRASPATRRCQNPAEEETDDRRRQGPGQLLRPLA